ncbi:MAG TPA: hypothetical protein PLT58_04360 [Atribacterota bacterium]|nr:hypothetical protein [Atribacterota bacterium]HOR42404.1 hypothetical protein [Atribacterota bacterium]HPK86631.1 hypothetical protein [Atribacterota bacterium]
MSDISKETLTKIKKEKVHPRPRWYFLTRNYLFWFMFALTTIMGSIAFGMILFITGDMDWDIYDYLGISLTKALLKSLPYLWIILLIFFLFVTYYNFIHTRTGYRYRFIMILFISLVISFGLGLTFYYYGWTETLDRKLRSGVPGYHHLVYGRPRQWMQPEKGLLSGIITKVELGHNLLTVKDESAKEWKIDISQAKIMGVSLLSLNQEIRILGQQTGKNAFKATEIRVFRGLSPGKRRRENWDR